MANKGAHRVRDGEAFWRAHHEAWTRSNLNQREYCEAQSIPLNAFGNWRATFKVEPQPSTRKLLYRRGGVSHSLRHTLSHSPRHTLSHVTYPCVVPPSGPILPPARAGLRRHIRRSGIATRQCIDDCTALWYRPTCARSVAAGADGSGNAGVYRCRDGRHV